MAPVASLPANLEDDNETTETDATSQTTNTTEKKRKAQPLQKKDGKKKPKVTQPPSHVLMTKRGHAINPPNRFL